MSVIIATWNAADVLGPCLDSVARQEVRGGLEVVVLDNASTDATAELLERYADEVRVVTNERNTGYGGGNNDAAPHARGDVMVFLNSDTELPAPDALERLASALEDPGVGLVGPMLLNPDGTLQPSCAAHPTLTRTVLLTSGAHRLLPDRLRARLVPHTWSHDHRRDTDWVMGCAFAIRAELFRELGGFWSTVYAEEQDLARRVQERGLRVRFEPAAKVVHVGNHSLGQRWSDPERAALVAAAEVAFLRRYHGRLRRAAIRSLVAAGHGARAIAHRVVGNVERAAVHRAMAGVYAGRHGQPA